ncbi:MAG: cohesin domain-containing protein [Methanosarcinaceae archaeon]
MSNNKMKDIIKVTVLAVLLLVSFCQIGLAAECTMSVSPQTISASQGDVFSIDIILDPADNEIYGAQYELHFDKNILQATLQNQGTFLSHGDTETIELINNINNAIGRVDYGETRVGNPDTIGGASENGVLASITFEVICSGTSELNIVAVLADPSAREINAVVNNGTCNVDGAGDGDASTSTTHEGQTSENNGLPGFGIVCSFIGLIAATLIVFRKELK